MNVTENKFIQIGFARYEIDCLLYLARVKKASTKKISREISITHNLAKVMLENLVKRGLVELASTPDQDTYLFLGGQRLKDYVQTEKNQQLQNYEAVENVLEELFID